AEALRRAMSGRRSRELMAGFWEEFRDGATARGVPLATAERVFSQVIAFSEFGFPKSHAAAFGLLAYQSAWLRHYHPAEYYCALFNNQPMGFYTLDALGRDAKRNGIEIRLPDVNVSDVWCTVEGRGRSRWKAGEGGQEAGGVAGATASGPRAAGGWGRGGCGSRPRRSAAAMRAAGASSSWRATTRTSACASAASRRTSGCSPNTRCWGSRRAGGRSNCCATCCRPEWCRATRSPGSSTGRGWRSRDWLSRASAPRPRKDSSLCCSRTKRAW